MLVFVSNVENVVDPKLNSEALCQLINVTSCSQTGRLVSPSDFTSMSGDLFPIALCGRSWVSYLCEVFNFYADAQDDENLLHDGGPP
jgi:hypothetical protein